jgi:hypothetical protein
VKPGTLEDVRVENNRIHATLQPASWNLLSLGAG